MRQGLVLTEVQRKHVSWLGRTDARAWLRASWPMWESAGDEKERIETALTMIADYQGNRRRPGHLATLLDDLAVEYTDHHTTRDVRSLSRFLFSQKALAGAQDDYYNPRNSDLVYVIEERKGIPISLVCVLMLVGHRVGLSIEGCNFPGHFLAMAYEEDRPLIIDCFHGGLFVDDALLARYLDPVTVTVRELASLRTDAATVIGRVLRNLIRAYTVTHQPEEAAFMAELLSALPGQSDSGATPPRPPGAA